MSKILGMDISGVFCAIFISKTSAGLFTLWFFKKGNWKKFGFNYPADYYICSDIKLKIYYQMIWTL